MECIAFWQYAAAPNKQAQHDSMSMGLWWMLDRASVDITIVPNLGVRRGVLGVKWG